MSAKKKSEKVLEVNAKLEVEVNLKNQMPILLNAVWLNWCNQFQHEQNRYLEGSVVPEELEMDLHADSFIFFGKKPGSNRFIGKPAHEDGHVLGVGPTGGGKTEGVVIPTLGTWKGIQIIIDVKGNLYDHWKKLNKHTGRKIMVFSPDAPKNGNCWYDPYVLLRHGGPEKLVGNARDLALALMPSVPTVNDPVWIQATQNFLTGAIIYYFDLGCSFNDTMVAIQTLLITELIQKIMGSENGDAKAYMSKLSEVD
ncbi:MAG: type IV secretory system conjugative DNA transfer family protein, partial [Clostridiales bacterium]|nr:type IV secretory system conjugative DNA transfer family protein [Clostridiales bacterium]